MGDIIDFPVNLSTEEINGLLDEAAKNLDRCVEIYLMLENYVSSAKLLQQLSLKTLQCAEIANQIHIVRESWKKDK